MTNPLERDHISPAQPRQRKRGGQPRNQNARKHGFYSKAFTRTELTDLEEVDFSLESEIATLRVLARRLLEQMKTLDPETINVIVLIISKIGSLVRTQNAIAGVPADVLSTALDDVIKDFNLSL